MSSSVVEILRAYHEEIEILEKSLADTFVFRDEHPKDSVLADMMANKIVDQI